MSGSLLDIEDGLSSFEDEDLNSEEVFEIWSSDIEPDLPEEKESSVTCGWG
jgi:hypothetical protein